MQKTRPATTATFRERLAPSLWLLGSAAVVAPMVVLTFVQFDQLLALALGIATAALVIIALVALSPVVEVSGGELRAGRAHIDVGFLGEPVAHAGEEARRARGTELDRAGWHLIRGGIDGIVTVPNTDPDDPVTGWTVSSRTPDRLAAAIRHAQAQRIG